MEEVKHIVVRGDTLSTLAKKYDTTIDNIKLINNLVSNTICIGQELIIKNKAITPMTISRSAPSSTRVSIYAFGIQSDTDNLMYAMWDWPKGSTAHYEVEWKYYTYDHIWFVGNNSNVEIEESTYTIPSNAIKVACRVKPVSETYTDSNNNEISYWTGDWCAYEVYDVSDIMLEAPSVPTVEMDNYTLKITNKDITIDANVIEYEIIQDDVNIFNVGLTEVYTGTSSYTINIAPGHRYKVRARGRRSYLIGNWSGYSENLTSIPVMSSGITSITSIDETTVKIEWESIPSAKTYTIEYAEKEIYFDGSNATTVIDNIETTSYIITGLTKGKRYYFRIRSSNDSGNSTWSPIKSITIGLKPEPPSTWSDKTTVMIGEKVLLSWIHNSADDSTQTQTEIEFQVNGVMGYHQIGMDINAKPINTFYLPTHMFVDGTKVYWRVRTKGVLDTYSDWSVQRVIDIYAPPTISLNILSSPNGDYINNITTFPFYIDVRTTSPSQKPITHSIIIRPKESYITQTAFGDKYINIDEEIYNDVIISKTDLLLEMHSGNIDLENNIEYEILCRVTMDSGLSVDANKRFTVKWIDVFTSPNAEILIDKKRLSASIRPYCERYEDVYKLVNIVNGKYVESNDELSGGFQNATSVDKAITNTKLQVYMDEKSRLFCIIENARVVDVTDVTLSVYRRTYDGKFVEIAKNLKGEESIFVTDPHPSLDCARYRIASSDNKTGAISYVDLVSYEIQESVIVIQWDDDWTDFVSVDENLEAVKYTSGSLVKLPYNIEISENTSQDVSTINYIGRAHPVSYYGTNLGIASTWNTVIDKNNSELLYALRRLSMYMGDVYVREPSGVGYWATVKVSYNKSYDSLVIPITFDIVRVDGGI